MAPRKSKRKKPVKNDASDHGGASPSVAARGHDDATAPAPDPPDEGLPNQAAPRPASTSSTLDTAAKAIRAEGSDPVELRRTTDERIQAYKSPFGPPPVAPSPPVTTDGSFYASVPPLAELQGHQFSPNNSSHQISNGSLHIVPHTGPPALNGSTHPEPSAQSAQPSQPSALSMAHENLESRAYSSAPAPSSHPGPLADTDSAPGIVGAPDVSSAISKSRGEHGTPTSTFSATMAEQIAMQAPILGASIGISQDALPQELEAGMTSAPPVVDSGMKTLMANTYIQRPSETSGPNLSLETNGKTSATGEATEPGMKPKRGRGRPRKVIVVAEGVIDTAANADNASTLAQESDMILPSDEVTDMAKVSTTRAEKLNNALMHNADTGAITVDIVAQQTSRPSKMSDSIISPKHVHAKATTDDVPAIPPSMETLDETELPSVEEEVPALTIKPKRQYTKRKRAVSPTEQDALAQDQLAAAEPRKKRKYTKRKGVIPDPGVPPVNEQASAPAILSKETVKNDIDEDPAGRPAVAAYQSEPIPAQIGAPSVQQNSGEAASNITSVLERDTESAVKPKRKYNKRKRVATPVEDSMDEPLPKRSAVSNDPPYPGDDVHAKPLKRSYRKSQVAPTAVQDVGNVENSFVGGEAATLACTFNNEAGSLILSADKSVLEFFGLEQHPPQVPLFSLLISEISRRPMTSARKSNPMCIRIKGNNDARGIDNAFAVEQSDEGYNAMHEMRANIVAASLHEAFKAQDKAEDPEANAKPYKCEKCQKRFRNKNGLEYHVLKSQTICNPAFDPSLATPKMKTGGRKKGVKTKVLDEDLGFDSENEDEEIQISDQEVDVSLITDVIPTEVPDDQGAESPASDDSIIAWGWKNVGRTPRRAPRRRGDPGAQDQAHKDLSDSHVSDNEPQKVARKKNAYKIPAPKRRYKAYHGEAPFLAEVAEELSNQQNDQVEHPEGDAANVLSDNELNPEACRKVFIDLVASRNGIFPGDKSMWFALVAVWLKNYKTSKSLPESKICSHVLDDLTESGKLKKLEFSFRDAKSRDVIRTVYTSPDYNEKDESFAETKEAIEAAHPGFYVPDGYAPPSGVLQQLEKLVSRSHNTVLGERKRHSEGFVGPDYEKDQDDFLVDETDFVEDEASLQHEMTDSVEDDLYLEDEISKESKNAKISRSIKKWHADRRAAGLAPPLSQRSLRKQSGLKSIPKRRSPTQEEKNKRYTRVASQPSWGDPAIAWIPNPLSGAWDSQPVRLRALPKATSAKPRRIVSDFAEPITSMQAENGAWSERPFGHGVKPTIARPARRNERNSTQLSYLERIENSFRPRLYPARTRSIGPAPASTRRLRENNLQRTKNSSLHQTPDDDFTDDPSFTPPDEDSDLDFGVQTRQGNAFRDLIPNPISRPRRRARNSTKFTTSIGPDLDEIEILNYIEAKKLPAASTENPGLSTLPPEFYGLTPQSNSSGHETGISQSRIVFLDPEPVSKNLEFLDGSWISNIREHQKRTYDKIRFDEKTAFTVDTLPYNHLDDNSEEENPPKRQRTRSSSVEPLQSKGKGTNTRTKKLVPTRPLTAFPTDFSGLAEEPAKLAKYLGVEVVEPSQTHEARKRLRMGNRMSKAEESRFLVTVIVIRTITGGLDQYIDWVIVSTLFPSFSLTHLNKCWIMAYRKKQELIEELVVDFQDAFLVAYRDGVIKPIDFDNLLQYDWARLVRWTIKNVNTSLTPETIRLPADRTKLKEDYNYNEVTRETGEVQHMYFGLTQPIYRRLDAIASRQATISIDRSLNPDEDDESISQLTIAKSYARASALTPIETWNWTIAKNRLTQLGSELLEEAIETLKDEKVIIQRNKAKSTTGRIYEASDAFAASLRKPVSPKVFLEAYHYKEFLDKEFRSGKKNLCVDYMGNEGFYMCISTLQAAGRLKLTGLHLPMDKMGLGDDLHPYDTKRIPKSKVRWDIDISPTSSYIYNDANDTLQNILTTNAPSSRCGAIPAWNGIGDIVIPDLWKRILCAVLSTIALRSGISKRTLRVAFQPTLEDWEISLLVWWGEENRILERAEEGFDGWCTCEDWWLCLGGLVNVLEELERVQKGEGAESNNIVNKGKVMGMGKDKVTGKFDEDDGGFESS